MNTGPETKEDEKYEDTHERSEAYDKDGWVYPDCDYPQVFENSIPPNVD